MKPDAREVNFDGLVGPTHNYAGLSYGNIASAAHGGEASNPRAAALEGLTKMKLLMSLGLTQGVLPPRERPAVQALRAWGFGCDDSIVDDAAVLEQAYREAPALLAAASSASSMWAANAATISPSADAADGCVHLTPANLMSHPHRAIEAMETSALLRATFPDERRFVHHRPVSGGAAFSDEGAANHTRLTTRHGASGLEMFVFGRAALRQDTCPPGRFPARQTLEASQAIARLHQLAPSATVFARQHPAAIDAGVFHNDVIAVGNRNVLLCHESAWEDQRQVIDELRRVYKTTCDDELIVIEIPDAQVPIADAVRSYLFNSQLVSLPGGDEMTLIYPTDCDDIPTVRAGIAEIVSGDNPIASAQAADVRQSMCNGGGPACLRLRVVLTDEELAATHAGVILTDALYEQLVVWVNAHYRDHLRPEDLRDPTLMDESRAALDDLTRLLDLPGLYDFQR